MQSIRNMMGKKKKKEKDSKTGDARRKSSVSRKSSISHKSRSSKRGSAMPAAAGPPPAPVTNDKPFEEVYVMGKKLGAGNFSTVYAATRKRGGHPVAVKRITKRKLKQADVDAIYAESAILQRIDHPHIIRMYDFMEDAKYFYIVTELVQGGELFERIVAKEYYSEKDAQQLVHTVAEALLYCHKRGVVHRDLKPENILLISADDDAGIKLADFGFAKSMDLDETGALTTACGTPGYVAPEVITGKPYGPEVDCWSLGVIMYILLCGYPPFYHDDQRKLFKLIKKGEFSFEPEFWGHVSESGKNLIRGLLSVNREERLTIEGVIKHPWFSEKVEDKDITPALQELRKYNAKRRWQTLARMNQATMGFAQAATAAKEKK